jgi:HSP20 family protein
MFVRFERFPVVHSMDSGVVDDLFGDNLNRRWGSARVAAPALDVAENNNELIIVAEIPGVQKEDVKVTIHDGVLAISGERKQRGLPDDSRWQRTETEAGVFSRSLELPVAVNASAVSAELKDGILRVVAPKAEEARPREIKVN